MSTISGVGGSGNAWAAAASTQRANHQARMFAKVDSDGSGAVDQTELGTMLDTISQKTGTSFDDTAKVFASMDTDSDGSLTSDELDTGMKSVMPPPPSTMDFANAHQGAGGPPPGGPPPDAAAGSGASSSSSSSTTYDPLDTNQDGTVSLAERLAGATQSDPVQELFKAMDANSDGKVSQTETDTFAKQLSDLVAQSTDSSATSASTDGTDQGFDIAKLAQMLYDQVAEGGLSSSSQGNTLSAVA